MLTRLAAPTTDTAGMTLAEVLVAVVVLSVALIGLASLIPMSVYGVHEGRALSSATFLAEQRLEEVRSAPWTATPELDCLGVSPGGPPESTSCARPDLSCPAGPCVTFPDERPIAGYPGYTRSVRVKDCADGAGCGGIMAADQRLVRVMVTYPAIRPTGGPAADASRSATLDMLVAKRR